MERQKRSSVALVIPFNTARVERGRARRKHPPRSRRSPISTMVEGWIHSNRHAQPRHVGSILRPTPSIRRKRRVRICSARPGVMLPKSRPTQAVFVVGVGVMGAARPSAAIAAPVAVA